MNYQIKFDPQGQVRCETVQALSRDEALGVFLRRNPMLKACDVICIEEDSVTLLDRPELPAIGAAYQGGIYAGLTIHEGKPFALVLLPGDEQMPWNGAVKWAEKQALWRGGKGAASCGSALPSRIDQLVLFQNLKGEFQEAWYWSAEQYAHNDAYAWCQSFYYGGQYDGHKSHDYRARAVRRVSLQELRRS